MATKAEKKNAIRQDIIDAAGVYSRDLADPFAFSGILVLVMLI